MVNIIFETNFGDHFVDSALSKGSKEVAKTHVARQIFCLDTLVGIHPKH